MKIYRKGIGCEVVDSVEVAQDRGHETSGYPES